MMRLRNVIFWVYVTSSAVGFLVLMALMLWEVRPRYVESMRRTMGETASLLASMLEARLQDLPSGGRPEVDRVWAAELASLQKNAGRMRVYVTDRDAIVIGDSAGGRDLGKNYTRRPEVAAYFENKYGEGADADLVAGELRVTAPVRVRGELVALVGVGRSLSSVQAFILSARRQIALEAAAIAAVMVLGAWLLASRVAGSLERLTAHVHALRRGGRETEAPFSRAREIQELSEAFEAMRRELDGKAYVERYTEALTHEIKAPLSGIRGAVELLGENPPEPVRSRFLDNLKTESERLHRIAQRLLELSAVEARHGRIEREPVDLRLLAEDLAKLLREGGRLAGRELRLNGESELKVSCERFLVHQALENLLCNALDFSPNGGLVELRLESAGACARIVVEDTGPGVPDYALPRVFERFYSLARPASGRKSTGLGLCLVREVARLHGGEARLENRPGGGARAVLELRRD